MGISYEFAPELQEQIKEISGLLFPHVKLDSVVCLRSYGSSSRGTIARCHALGKAMQLALGRKGFYVIEVISKRFDKLSEKEKTKTLIHELMHIPKSFGGGFIHHDVVHEGNVEKMYERYCSLNGKNTNDPRFLDFDSFEERELTPGQRVERDFFVVLEKKETKPAIKKKWWF
jgi:predicted metallopeptidase